MSEENQTEEKNNEQAEILIIPNDKSNPLAYNDDFMKALHDFQYGNEEESARGFEQMKKTTNPESK